MARAAGPDTRTIPTPPRPGGVAIAAMVSVLAMMFVSEGHSHTSLTMRLVMMYCCTIDSVLFTTQYNTRPAGNHRKKKVNITGIHYMIFACLGSGGAGFSFC